MTLLEWKQFLDAHEGVRNFDLREDRVLIRRMEEPSFLHLTDAPKSIKGIVLATGPGKWIPGDWYKVGEWFEWRKNKPMLKAGDWEWFPGHYQPMEVKPGMSVLFNSKWNDFTSGENKGTGCDLSGPLERPLPLHADPTIHLVQEADIFCIIPDIKINASIKPDRVSAEFFHTKEIIGPWNGGNPNEGTFNLVNGRRAD
jgi:hypothetical protein